ncbi:MAG: nucleotidyltransferase family protein [Ruminococcus sp.]|nr:nucleotidyltransferase family protein [Ruminococcus sp.]
MKASAIICEYNPFHNGHKFLIESVESRTDNAVVAIMSGSFTQRGDVAIFDKFSRAATAVRNGADLVIELPTVYSVSSAQNFARAGVRIAAALGCTDELCFGAEDDIELLKKAAEMFYDDSFNERIKRNMDDGDYYPQAVSKAAAELAPELGDVLAKPNNILAVEYIKALRNTDIQPFAARRKGASHDTDEISEGIASASKIRKMILSGEKVDDLIPETDLSHPADINRFESQILYRLRTMNKTELSLLPDVSEGLENRLYDAIRSSKTVDELIYKVKTKRYTHARLRRVIIAAFLNINADMPKVPVPYLRVLAMNNKGAELLGAVKQNGKLPLITNVADGYGRLDGKAREIFDIDLRATDLHSLATDEILPCGEDFTRGIIKI